MLLLTTVVFGVGNYLTDGIIPYIGSAIKDAWSPPRCTIIFSKAVDLDTPSLDFTPIPREDRRTLKVTGTDKQYVTLSGSPGDYFVTLRRADSRVLPTRFIFKRDENFPIDTSDDKWERQETIKQDLDDKVHSPDSKRSGSDILREVRWSATSADLAQVSLAKTKESKTLLTNALQEVGVNEGDPANKARVYEYWSGIPQLRERNQITPDKLGPWGGAFLTWVVMKSGLKPPALSSAYNSWPAWGANVPNDSPEPGMIALFATKAVPGLTGSFLAGIVLRKRPDCTEIVTGNIVGRVVIACVSLPTAVVRRS